MIDIDLKIIWLTTHDDLAQDCSNSIANALELLQSCAKPSYYLLRNYSFHGGYIIIIWDIRDCLICNLCYLQWCFDSCCDNVFIPL